VTPHAGTTRDLVTERVEVLGAALTIVDTAGVRETTHPIEREGVARAQADKRRYGAWVRDALDREPNIEWILGRAGRILTDGDRAIGLALEGGDVLRCDALIVTTGTFLNGVIHVGPEQMRAGRAGEPASHDLAESLKSFGFTWGRLKTGTPPRINRRQIACHALHTSEAVHALVRAHIAQSPLYNGQIRGIGPRYCPSLEDKVMRFPERERHQIVLEPEGLDVDEIYVNGFSMSLPRATQAALVAALPGLEDAVMLRPGYAVEYDFVQPTELGRPGGMRRHHPGSGPGEPRDRSKVPGLSPAAASRGRAAAACRTQPDPRGFPVRARAWPLARSRGAPEPGAARDAWERLARAGHHAGGCRGAASLRRSRDPGGGSARRSGSGGIWWPRPPSFPAAFGLVCCGGRCGPA